MAMLDTLTSLMELGHKHGKLKKETKFCCHTSRSTSTRMTWARDPEWWQPLKCRPMEGRATSSPLEAQTSNSVLRSSSMVVTAMEHQLTVHSSHGIAISAFWDRLETQVLRRYPTSHLLLEPGARRIGALPGASRL